VEQPKFLGCNIIVPRIFLTYLAGAAALSTTQYIQSQLKVKCICNIILPGLLREMST
jgi:hypothetical protein